jgi:hypothetical protein
VRIHFHSASSFGFTVQNFIVDTAVILDRKQHTGDGGSGFLRNFGNETILHGVASQKAELFRVRVVRTSELARIQKPSLLVTELWTPDNMQDLMFS